MHSRGEFLDDTSPLTDFRGGREHEFGDEGYGVRDDNQGCGVREQEVKGLWSLVSSFQVTKLAV